MIGVWVNPLSAVSTKVSELTGVAGERSIGEQVSSVSAQPLPLAAAALILVAVTAISVSALVLASGWRASRKYAASGARGPARSPSDVLDRQDAWDSLSLGEDPTAEGR